MSTKTISVVCGTVIGLNTMNMLTAITEDNWSAAGGWLCATLWIAVAIYWKGKKIE